MSIAPPTPTITPEREAARRGYDDRPARVVVLDDDVNTFEWVAACLAKVVPGVSPERGLGYAVEIHTCGRATVWTGHVEIAELYHTQLAGLGLTMAPLER